MPLLVQPRDTNVKNELDHCSSNPTSLQSGSALNLLSTISYNSVQCNPGTIAYQCTTPRALLFHTFGAPSGAQPSVFNASSAPRSSRLRRSSFSTPSALDRLGAFGASIPGARPPQRLGARPSRPRRSSSPRSIPQPPIHTMHIKPQQQTIDIRPATSRHHHEHFCVTVILRVRSR
jgi:hypothetical protein